MDSWQLVIEPQAAAAATTRRRGTPPKSRRFQVSYLAHICANGWWSGGQATADATRPVWLVCAGTERATRPFVANLQTGHRAALVPYRPDQALTPSPVARIELLKSAGYRFLWQRLTGGSDGPLVLVTAYLPELFVLDPGMIDPEGIAFLALTPTWWAEQERAALAHDTATRTTVVAHLKALAGRGRDTWRGFTPETWLDLLPQAVHVVSFLERRTPRPLVSTPAFTLQLFLAGLEQGIWTRPLPTTAGGTRPLAAPADEWAWAYHTDSAPVVAHNAEAVGLEPPIACRTTQAQLDAFLAAQVTRYFAVQDAGSQAQAA